VKQPGICQPETIIPFQPPQSALFAGKSAMMTVGGNPEREGHRRPFIVVRFEKRALAD
jgi:hypothetical protein